MKFDEKRKNHLEEQILKYQKELEEIKKTQEIVDSFHPLTKKILEKYRDHINTTVSSVNDTLVQNGLILEPIIKEFMFNYKVENLINEKEET